MDPVWQGLLFNLMKHDLVNDKSTPNKGRKRIGRRGGRGGRALMQEFELESVNDLLKGGGNHDYRLACLLTHKTMMGDDWNNSWNMNLNEWRNVCNSKGIHPVFNLLAKTFKTIIGEMEIYDIVEEEIVEDLNWIKKCNIDPTDFDMLIKLLEPPIGINLNATILAPLKRMYEQMERKGNLKPQWIAKQIDAKLLNETTGGPGLLAGILAASSENNNAEKRFEDLSKEDGEIGQIGKNQLLLLKIRKGDQSIWDECINLAPGNSLTDACRAEAWSKIPEQLETLSIDELINGYNEIKEWNNKRKGDLDYTNIKWKITQLKSNNKQLDNIDEYFNDLEITNDYHLITALSLLGTNSNEVVIEKLKRIISEKKNLDLSIMLNYELVPIDMRLNISQMLGGSGETNEKTEKMMLELFTTSGDITSLSNVLKTQENAAKKNAHLTLVAARLIGAEVENDLLQWVVNSRKEAFMHLPDCKLPDYLSPASFALTSLLDGGSSDLEEIGSILDANGVQAFKQCRRAMMDEGDGLVPEQLLTKLEESIKTSKMNIIERRLFEQLILNLKLNRADALLQDIEKDKREEAADIIENVLSIPPTYRIINNVNAQILEQGISSNNLDKWYKENNPQSVEAAIATGRTSEKRGNRIQAARSYHLAATRTDDFELRQKLNKDALVSYAHAGSWPEAIELLESEPGLKANITDRFKLYLKVNEEVSRGNNNGSRDIILSNVKNIEIKQKTNESGETYDVKIPSYSMEELNLHLTYPSIHRLPEQPFRGRVIAAINWVQRDSKRKGGELESQFQRALNRQNFTEIWEVANRETENRGAEHGLLFYERAINSGKFDVTGLQRLSEMQRTMYSRTEHSIPIKKRIHLTNLPLKSLVIVDTNLLVDALVEKVMRQLEIEKDIPLHLDNRRAFHKTLYYHSKQGKINLNIPESVRREFERIAKTPNRVKNICGDLLVNPKLWNEKMDEKKLVKLAKEIIDDYNSWDPKISKNELIIIEENMVGFDEFFSDLETVYDNITNAKIARGSPLEKRTKINEKQIYPEDVDIKIMLLSKYLGEQSIDGFGSILIASRDSDFTIPARALQERFGFVIVENAQSLSRYIN